MVVEEMENEISRLPLSMGMMELEGLDLGRNLSALYGEGVQAGESADPVAYEQFLADVWIGIVLTLMVLSCVCCMCSCLLYHKFQQWKRSVLMTRNGSNVESGNNPETESLPSYTVVSGLPSYEEALEQLKKVKELTGGGDPAKSLSPPGSTNNTETVTRLSVTDLFQIYKQEGAGSGKNS